jgi:Zn-dependent protease
MKGSFQLRFHLGKIPVRIHPTFFLVAAFIAVAWDQKDPLALAALVAVVLVSVLLHELGHAATGFFLGVQPSIELHIMGGTTSWTGGADLSAGKRIAISLAGPAAGFALAAFVHGLGLGAFPPTPFGAALYEFILFVNFRWGVLNLLPMLPLDGGNVMAQVLNLLTRGRGERPARIVSLGFAGLAVVAGAVLGEQWWLFLALSFVLTNWRGLQDLAAREHDAPMRESLKQAYEALDAGDGPRVLALARPVALESRSTQVKAEALQLVAFGFLLEDRVADADAAIAALPRGYAPHPQLLELRAATAGSAG